SGGKRLAQACPRLAEARPGRLRLTPLVGLAAVPLRRHPFLVELGQPGILALTHTGRNVLRFLRQVRSLLWTTQKASAIGGPPTAWPSCKKRGPRLMPVSRRPR